MLHPNRRLRAVVIAAVVAVLACTAVFAAGPIEIVAAGDVRLSSIEGGERATASFRGDACATATFTFTVTRGDRELFRHQAPMGDVVPCGWYDREPAKARASAAGIVDRAIAVVPAGARSCGGSRPLGCTEDALLAELQERDAPLLCFPVDVEASACVGYDAERDEVRVVWSYSE